mmetsp:Transcript_7202/g.26116  ORF Transcript_7202/g.26116 Transcript_7202/m.26116 type:complete len:282 (-) Transcript_7202:1993-2838(-)
MCFRIPGMSWQAKRASRLVSLILGQVVMSALARKVWVCRSRLLPSPRMAASLVSSAPSSPINTGATSSNLNAIGSMERSPLSSLRSRTEPKQSRHPNWVFLDSSSACSDIALNRRTTSLLKVSLLLCMTIGAEPLWLAKEEQNAYMQALDTACCLDPMLSLKMARSTEKETFGFILPQSSEQTFLTCRSSSGFLIRSIRNPKTSLETRTCPSAESLVSSPSVTTLSKHALETILSTRNGWSLSNTARSLHSKASCFAREEMTKSPIIALCALSCGDRALMV